MAEVEQVDQIWLISTTGVSVKVSAGAADDSDFHDAIRQSMAQHAVDGFKGEHPDAQIRLTRVRDFRHKVLDFDPETYTPLEEPEHHYIARVDVYYTDAETIPY